MPNINELPVMDTPQGTAEQPPASQTQPPVQAELKFCKHCGKPIAKDAVLCIHCGRQVEELSGSSNQSPNIVINNSNSSQNTNIAASVPLGALKKEKNKWVAVLLCFFLGVFGGHKFYEGKIGMGILYLLTLGLFGIGVLIDFIALLFKPNPYYV